MKVNISVLVCIVAFALVGCSESPESKAAREAAEAWRIDHEKYAAYVEKCREKNKQLHFGPILDFATSWGPNFCEGNGVVCTSNPRFQKDLATLWDAARARGACIIWQRTTVSYGGWQTNRGAEAYADDNRGAHIAVGLYLK